jgi:ketosteroid isomerase-like protein
MRHDHQTAEATDQLVLARGLGLRGRGSDRSEIEHELRLTPTSSHDMVKVVLDAYADYNDGGGKPSLDYWHEDAEYHTAPEDPDSAAHRGIDAISRLFASWREAYPDLRVEVQDAKAQCNQVFAWVRLVGRGAASGIPVEMELAHVYTMRKGKAARLVEWVNRADALDAAGLADPRSLRELQAPA